MTLRAKGDATHKAEESLSAALETIKSTLSSQSPVKPGFNITQVFVAQAESLIKASRELRETSAQVNQSLFDTTSPDSEDEVFLDELPRELWQLQMMGMNKTDLEAKRSRVTDWIGRNAATIYHGLTTVGIAKQVLSEVCGALFKLGIDPDAALAIAGEAKRGEHGAELGGDGQKPSVRPIIKAAENHLPMRAGSIAQQTRPTPQSNNEKAATWETVEISFLSEERVQIRNGAGSETRNYDEFGFADRRNGAPKQAWVTLRTLAEQNGTIRDGKPTGRNWVKIEKSVQEIRKVLRKHFGIPADPIPFVHGKGYQARFKIGCNPSFDT